MSDIIVYPILFLGVYVQVFLFVTFLENRKKIVVRNGTMDLSHYPGVTVMVPCYNEVATISRTVASLLALDYPKEKLHIILIDDGSTDDTLLALKQFESKEGVLVLNKKNGGKHTALNLGLEYTKTEFVGCLDSDSVVDPHALKRIMSTFNADETLFAVVPSVLVDNPKNIIQRAQKAEYDLAVYNKKMLGFLGGIHVTPGPFSIFKKKVFNELGPYRKAHNTEDQEIALRMHKHGYKIDNCPDAYVYTAAPKTIAKLYHQRVRWTYGFLRNMVDYRQLLFKKKFGNLGFFTLPSGIISLFGIVTMFGLLIGNIISFVYNRVLQLQTLGLANNLAFKVDFFFFNTHALLFIVVTSYFFVTTAIFVGKRIAEGKPKFPIDILYLIPLYSVVAPFWIVKSFWNAIFKRESNWAMERATL